MFFVMMTDYGLIDEFYARVWYAFSTLQLPLSLSGFKLSGKSVRIDPETVPGSI